MTRPVELKSRDEKIKLLAGLLNICASTCFSVGVIAPVVAVLLNIGDASLKVPLIGLILNTIFWLLAACVLHLAGRGVLSGLDE